MEERKTVPAKTTRYDGGEERNLHDGAAAPRWVRQP
jgi:hypothetical protein